MPLREHLHDDLDMVAVFGPLRPEVLIAFPDAVVRYLSGDESTELHRRRRPGRAWGHIGPDETRRLASSVFRTTEERLDPSMIAITMIEEGYPGLPIAFLESHGLLAVMLPHDLFDGTSSWAHLSRIFALAMPDLKPPVLKPLLTKPVRAALRTSKLTDRESLMKARSARREAERGTACAEQFPEGRKQSRARRSVGFHNVVLDAETVRLLDRSVTPADLASGSTGRSTRGMKLAAAALEAFSEAIPQELDYRYRLQVDLRRYAPRGVRIEGPMSTGYPVGRLRSGDNSAIGLTARFGAALTSKGPLMALVGNLIGLVRQRVRSPFGAPAGDGVRRSFDLGISVISTPVPADAWADTPDVVNGVLLLHPRTASDPFVQIADVRDQVVLGLWDEVGAVDPQAFEAALRRALSERVVPGASATPSGQPAAESEVKGRVA